MVQGPLANETVLMKVNNEEDRKRDVVLIAAGTGIAPMLQLIDYYCCDRPTTGLEPPRAGNSKPKVFLTWIVQCKSLSFEGAAELRNRVHLYGGKFNYFIVYAQDTLERGGTSQRRRLLMRPQDADEKKLRLGDFH